MFDRVTSAAIPAPERGSAAVPAIGITIPTFNRSDVILQCLGHLERQSFTNFEVVVVDDGSSDQTPRLLEEYAVQTPLRFRYVRQQNAGPASARNHAISLLTASFFLMIGDDIMAGPDLVRKHLNFHQHNPDRAAFAIGYTRWSQEGQTVTPFMRWLEEKSPLQFAYSDLLRGVQPSWQHFYTSNLSGKTDVLRTHRFAESFRYASMEDIELGYRLARRNELDVHFLPGAVAEHIHPTDVGLSCRRMITVGHATDEFWRVWPEREPAEPEMRWKARLRRSMLERGIGLRALRYATATLTRFRCPNVLLTRALMLHFEAGLRQAQLKNR